MQLLPRLASPWHALVAVKRLRMLLGSKQRLPALLLALALGFFPQTTVGHAQDGGAGSGQLLSVSYALEIDTAGLSNNRLCLGRTVNLPIKVLAFVEVQGGATASPIEVRRASFTTTVQNPSVISAQGIMSGLGAAQDAPFSAHLELRGEGVGRTRIDVSGLIESSTHLSLDEEAGLPIVTMGQTPTASVEVQIVPCQYRVDIGSVWVTSLWGANAWVSSDMINLRLTSTTGTTFDTSAMPANLPGMKWRTLMNRIRGCLVSDQHWDFFVPPIRGEVLDDTISLSIGYSRVAPPLSYYRTLCPIPAGITPGYCPDYPDRTCFVARRPGGDWFEPKSPTDPLIFRLEGETIRVPQTLIHAHGTATGSITITLTPILSQ
ncbi:MAG: hypothetical protein IT323_04720 [Anaerolineae bacterium]|nr:hypothetical protein [Anaerolineae bacterium]